ncbi:MAG: AraC family transcriptional regulator [Ginsengibacter sp.]
MTFYEIQIESISREIYSNVYLTKQVIQAKYFIDNNFSNNITLEDICKAGYISKYHLIRSFKKLYGKTPNQYSILVRINRAKELLRKDNSVLEVCFAVGFDSPTTFAGLFKKIVGSSPRSFKNYKIRKAIFKRF